MDNNIFHYIGQAQGILTSPIRSTFTPVINTVQEVGIRHSVIQYICIPIGNAILDSSPLKIAVVSYAVVSITCKVFSLDNQVCKTTDYIFEKFVNIFNEFTVQNDHKPNLRGSLNNTTSSAGTDNDMENNIVNINHGHETENLNNVVLSGEINNS